MRRKGAARRDVETDIEGVETVWRTASSPDSPEKPTPAGRLSPVAFVEGPAMVSELTLHGAPAGTPVWFEKGSGVRLHAAGTDDAGLVVIGPNTWKTNYGGWPFTPDTTWLNLQDHRGASFQDAAGEAGHGRQGLRTVPAQSTRSALRADAQRERARLRRLPLAWTAPWFASAATIHTYSSRSALRVAAVGDRRSTREPRSRPGQWKSSQPGSFALSVGTKS